MPRSSRQRPLRRGSRLRRSLSEVGSAMPMMSFSRVRLLRVCMRSPPGRAGTAPAVRCCESGSTSRYRPFAVVKRKLREPDDQVPPMSTSLIRQARQCGARVFTSVSERLAHHLDVPSPPTLGVPEVEVVELARDLLGLGRVNEEADAMRIHSADVPTPLAGTPGVDAVTSNIPDGGVDPRRPGTAGSSEPASDPNVSSPDSPPPGRGPGRCARVRRRGLPRCREAGIPSPRSW